MRGGDAIACSDRCCHHAAAGHGPRDLRSRLRRHLAAADHQPRLVAPGASLRSHRAGGRDLVDRLAYPLHALQGVPAGRARLLDDHIGCGPRLPGGPRHPRPVPGDLAEREPDRDHRRPRRGGYRGHRAAAAAGGYRPAADGAAVRAQRQALGARRRHQEREPGDPGAVRLRHELGARAAPRGARAVRRPQGRRGGHPAERLPGQDQRVAADRRLDDRCQVPRLRARSVPRRCRGLPVRPDRRLPPRGGAAGARKPRGRVLRRAAVHLR
jgi:hypothetical protein